MHERWTVALNGFNRRCDLPAIERCIVPTDAEVAALEQRRWSARLDRLFGELVGLETARRPSADRQPGGGDALTEAADRLAQTTIELQRAAGFDVDRAGALEGPRAGTIRFFAEYDLEAAGLAAADLAVALLEASLELDCRPAAGNHSGIDRHALAARFGELARMADDALPADTRALIDAARRRGIPFFRMDRAPYHPIRGPFRLRPNGLLRLGHAVRQRTVDGSFCIERSKFLHPTALDRTAMLRHARAVGLALPLAAGDDPRACSSPTRALRSARRTGFPVVSKTVRRRAGGVALGLRDEDALAAAVDRLLRLDDSVFIERSVDGRTVEVLFVGRRRFAVLEGQGGPDSSVVEASTLPESVLRALDGFADRLELLCLTVALTIADAAGTEADGAADGEVEVFVVDIDPAPRMDRLLEGRPDLLAQAAERMLDWLFPEQGTGRIEVVAVTGTNGKTTTCWLLERILRESGRRTGLACSTGSYRSGVATDALEDGHLAGHMTVLDDPGVELAVLETTRGGAMSTGIGFDHCDVAIGLNVTQDHLDAGMGVGTIEAMAGVKQWIVERGRRVVLNADDEHCTAMAAELVDRRPVLVSCRASASEIESLPGFSGTALVLAWVDGREWIMLLDAGRSRPLIAVDSVPVTLGGRARHNVSNALHAAAAAHLLGAGEEAIAAGLAAVRPDPSGLPARLNRLDAGGIEILVDYAHNPAGLTRFAEVCEAIDVPGRRIIAVTLPVDRGEEFVVDGVGAIAGRFDHYVCKSYRLLYGRETHEVPELLRAGLLRAGVAPDRITAIANEDDGITHALEMAGPGDLVALTVGKSYRDHLARIEAFAKDRNDR